MSDITPVFPSIIPATFYGAAEGEKTASTTKKASSMEGAAKEFESLFLTQMLEHMFPDAEGEDNVFGDQESGDVYRSWMIEQYGRVISNAGGIGVADHVRAQLIKLQEIKDAQPETTQPKG